MANEENTLDEQTREEDQASDDFWSDQGARRFNEALDEGAAYRSALGDKVADGEIDIDDVEREYRDPELYDPDEETLPPGEMELIFNNCYVM